MTIINQCIKWPDIECIFGTADIKCAHDPELNVPLVQMLNVPLVQMLNVPLVQMMERLLVVWVAIAAGHVDPDDEVQAHSAPDVVKESGVLKYLDPSSFHLLIGYYTNFTSH